MFEGFVRQLILGYLGRFVKDIQKEQLKITLWNEEVLLENVELSLEAFDYLQLPFALRQGRVGKLSIKIPWKKLGWDPIVIILEDVFVSASRRDDQEWSAEAVEKRESAGKKAKLAAAELAKLSKRVCDNRAGRLFTSYISAKILDSIQVSMRTLHVVYHDLQGDSVHTMFGLKFSSLTIMKQNLVSSTSARTKGGQVNKTLEMTGLELYCTTYHGHLNILSLDDAMSYRTKCDSILAPCDVYMVLLINRAGEFDKNNPQHFFNTSISALEVSLDEVQLHQLLVLWDYLCTSQLRERYGRYRPWCSPVSKKLDGWTKMWWRYAQESVLSDVQKKLKKTSWRYFGERLSYRRKYVNMYKDKLYSLRQDQPIDGNVLSELEQMEKELDIEDILRYRSSAECRLQETLSKASAVSISEAKQSLIRSSSVGVLLDKSKNDENLTGKSRGWLNWLSLGMLGAGGTDDSSQFSGVVSDEVIKDIYEATEFHPMNTSDVNAAVNDEIYFYVVKFSIHHISTTLRSIKRNQEIAQFVILGSVIECKLWENSVTILTAINSGEIIYPNTKKVVLQMRRPPMENKLMESEHPSLKLQVEASSNSEVDLLIKGVLEPVEVTYDAELYLYFMEFFGVFNSFESQHDRVLSSLNGISDADSRLLLKAEYILSSYQKVIWDICINSVLINIPWENEVTRDSNMVVKISSVAFTTKSVLGTLVLEDAKQLCHPEKYVVGSSTHFEIEDFSDQLEVKIDDLELMIRIPSHCEAISIFEKFNTSVVLTCCVVPDESIPRQLEVFVNVSSLHANLSSAVYGAVLELSSQLRTMQQQALFSNVDSPAVKSNQHIVPDFRFAVTAKFEQIKVLVDLVNDGESSLALIFVLQDLDICYALASFEKCCIAIKTLNVMLSSLRGETVNRILCSSGNHMPSHSQDDKLDDRKSSDEIFLSLYYDTQSTELACRKYTICLSDAEVHCYPFVIRLVTEFLESLSAFDTPADVKNSFSSLCSSDRKRVPGFGFQRFGCSNYFEPGFPEYSSIPVDHFPFVTISNGGTVDSLENACFYSSSDWRKYFSLRDRRIRTQQFSKAKEYKDGHGHAEASKFTVGEESVFLSKCLAEIGASLFELSICGISLHFHDSSSVVGTLTLPSSSSSVFVNEDGIDALFSLEGVVLTSPWWTTNFHEFLWGPSFPNISPIINVRVRDKEKKSSSSHLEVGVSVQHVYCIVPPEYLAIIIGYFSLPDWTSNSNENQKAESIGSITENENLVVLKFEILDSILVLPAESVELQFLKVDIPQLYISFIPNCSSDLALKGIPKEYCVPAHKLATNSDCLNICGRDIVLSVLSCKADALDCSRLEKDAIAMIAPLCADVWVRLPCGSEISPKSTLSTRCIMTRLVDCQITTKDCHICLGAEALWGVISQFSLVSELAECFKSDVVQFLQLKKCFKENISASPMASSIVLTEFRCHTDSLSIKLSHSGKSSSEQSAMVKMRFTLSAVLKNDSLSSLDLNFTSLEFFSLPGSIMLARFTSPYSTSPVLDFSLVEGLRGRIEVCISFPSLDIWIHFSEWIKIIDTVVSNAEELPKASPLISSSNILMIEKVDIPDDTITTASPVSASADNLKENGILSVKLENIGIVFHIPLCSTSTTYKMESSSISSSDTMGASDSKYVSVAMQSKASELFIDGNNARFKTKMEKWSGTIEVSEEKNVLSWPFFQLSHVFMDVEVDMMEQACIKVELRLDHLKVWLSHYLFYFSRGVDFRLPEAGSSQFPFGGIDFDVKARKVSILLSDGRWSCSGPLFEVIVRNTIMHVKMTENCLDSLFSGVIQVSYNNIHKVFWEPFIEPWKLEIGMTRKQELSLNSSIVTDLHLRSIEQLNLDFTEPLVECVLRTQEMINDSLGASETSDASETKKLSDSPWKHMYAGKYAPYVLQNLTSVPLVYHVYKGLPDELNLVELIGKHAVEPSASVPLHLNDTPEEQLFDVWPAHSSDRLNEEKLSNTAHHFISIQLDGISVPSTPISMDRVGLTFLGVDISKSYSNDGSDSIMNTRNGFVVPVVFDVSVQRYSKLIRLYSTVILSNATSFPIELRFDIPFGVAPMILDPVYPGQEFPLPLHLAEAGRIRWRPFGNSHLWSEVYNLANLLLQETKIGFLKSSVCYPALPSDYPFRCCLSVKNISMPFCGRPSSGTYNKNSTSNHVKTRENLCKPDESNKRLVRYLTLHSPLVVKNYLPKELSLTIESGGATHTACLLEVETFFHSIDPLHDLGLEIHMQGYKPATLKFPRAEIFCTVAKFNGSKFSLSESIKFDPYANGPISITVEKMMDALSGVREISIYVPILLYNCTGFPLAISESGNEVNSVSCIIRSSYNLCEQEFYQAVDGLSMTSVIHDSHSADLSRIKSSSSGHIFSKRDTRFQSSLLNSENSKEGCQLQLSRSNYSSDILKKSFSFSSTEMNTWNSNFVGQEREKIGPCMFSPVAVSSGNELSITVSRAQSENDGTYTSNLLWSSPFIVPLSGSTTVLVPQSSSNSAYMISVSSSAVSGPLTGRLTAIIFQPRYVISNACSKDLCYKQKGNNQVFRLRTGDHSHLHWMDITRELLVSIRYDEPGWQWSGSFLPDHLGDTQVKMQNYVSGSSSIIRVEVQNADISVSDEKVVGSLRGNSGTILILLSDDDTGYMPYRIDNFSKEKLRIFQQKCETFETLIHPYTFCTYAWDEPCYPHRLTVEVPGERILGSYSLDDVKVYTSIDLPSSLEKPERKLILSVHAEGATKVLSVVDSNNHVLEDLETSNLPHLRERKKHESKQDKVFHYTEKISIVIPYLGISLINIHPQELLFACARNITVDLQQSLDQQKLSFQISSLQIDNQLRSSQYPIMLCFDNECKNNQSDKKLHISPHVICEPAVYIGVSKWRKKDISLVSFECISLRIADFHLELEQEVILSLFDFVENVTSRFYGGVIQLSDPLSLMSDSALVESTSQSSASQYHQQSMRDKNHPMNVSIVNDFNKHYKSLLSVVPIGAPWQKIYLLARRHKKIYIEAFEISSIKLTLSFSSAPWILRNGVLASGESVIHRGLMALADVEGAQVHLKQLTIEHHISSWEAVQEILVRHFSRQLLHEIYKVFGSAGVIGNPMGFARTLSLGLRDFLSVPARTIFESPTGLITGMAQGTTSLVSNTVYAISDATTQFSKAAHKGIVAFTFDGHAASRLEQQQHGGASHSKGVINAVLEGLTGLLQLPIEGAEKHGLPGVLSGIALGVTGLVAKPAASILQVTGKTAQSIRNRSKIYQMRRKSYRTRLPRPLSMEAPLRPYSWEEAIGKSALSEAGDGLRLKEEILVTCKALKQAGKFVVITERLILTASCSSLADLGKPEFRGVPADLEWVIEAEIGLESVIHADSDQEVVHIVGSSSDTLLRGNQRAKVRWNSPTIPLVQTNLEFIQTQDAENLLQVLLSTIERGKGQGWGCTNLLRRSCIKHITGGM